MKIEDVVAFIEDKARNEEELTELAVAILRRTLGEGRYKVARRVIGDFTYTLKASQRGGLYWYVTKAGFGTRYLGKYPAFDPQRDWK